MRITPKRIEQMRVSLRYLVSIGEEKSSVDWEADNEEAEAIFAAVEGFEELIRRLERRTGQ
jgi:hypothetical protein